MYVFMSSGTNLCGSSMCCYRWLRVPGIDDDEDGHTEEHQGAADATEMVGNHQRGPNSWMV